MGPFKGKIYLYSLYISLVIQQVLEKCRCYQRMLLPALLYFTVQLAV